MTNKFEIGDIVIDSYQNKGIVVKIFTNILEAPSFSDNNTSSKLNNWLDEQVDSRLKKYADKTWLSIIVLTGGSCYAPEGLCTKIRRANDNDFKVAMKNGNAFAQEILNKITRP